LQIASIALLKIDTTSCNCSGSRVCGSDLVVSDWELSSLLGLGSKNGGSRNGQSSLDVDHLREGSSKTAKSGGSNENVTHLDGGSSFEEITEKGVD
jgi:hypothetical protein